MPQLGFKQNAKSLLTPISIHDMVVIADRLVLVGGAIDATGSSAGAINALQTARLLPDGSTTDFKIAGSLPGPRVAGDTILSGGFLIQLGGQDISATAQSTIYVAPVNSEGAIVGGFKTYAFPKTGMVGHRLAAFGGFVYCIGGGAANSQEVYFAKQQVDGSFNAWTKTQPLPQPLSYHAVAVLRNGFLFVTGGYNGTSVQSTVYSAKIQVDGSLLAWTYIASLSTPRWRHSSVVTVDKVYAIGGSPDLTLNSALSSTEFGQFNADGSITRFFPTGGLWYPARNARAVLKEGKIVVTGGHDVNGNGISTIMTAIIQSDGHL